MARITFVNSVSIDPVVRPPLEWQHEPVQFLGMMNMLTAAGHEVTLVDGLGGLLSVKAAAKQVIASRPDILGVSGYISREDTVMDFDRGVVQRARKALPDVKVWLGGPVTFFRASREPAIRALRPDVAVVGEGEIPVQALIASGLSAAGLRDPRIIVETFMDTAVLRARVSADLDSIDYRRPPTWSKYVLRDLDWQRFCLGPCKFCGGLRRRPTYVSPQRAADELQYLMKTGPGRRFFVDGPEFMQVPEKAAAIAEEIARRGVRGIELMFEARVPEFTTTMRSFASPWTALGRGNSLAVYLGLESAVPDLLLHMGKVRTENEAWQYLPGLLDVLDREPAFKHYLAWMLLKPGSTPATTLFDLLVVRAILAKYPHTDMNPPSILNNMGIRPGMKYHAEGLAEWVKDTPRPIRALHTYMATLQSRQKMGPVRRWIGRQIALASSQNPMSAMSERLKNTSRPFAMMYISRLTQFLLNEMSPAEARQALDEARALAARFGDRRVLELFDSQAGPLKGLNHGPLIDGAGKGSGRKIRRQGLRPRTAGQRVFLRHVPRPNEARLLEGGMSETRALAANIRMLERAPDGAIYLRSLSAGEAARMRETRFIAPSAGMVEPLSPQPVAAGLRAAAGGVALIEVARLGLEAYSAIRMHSEAEKDPLHYINEGEALYFPEMREFTVDVEVDGEAYRVPVAADMESIDTMLKVFLKYDEDAGRWPVGGSIFRSGSGEGPTKRGWHAAAWSDMNDDGNLSWTLDRLRLSKNARVRRWLKALGIDRDSLVRKVKEAPEYEIHLEQQRTQEELIALAEIGAK